MTPLERDAHVQSNRRNEHHRARRTAAEQPHRAAAGTDAGLLALAGLLLGFFAAFNVLEALLPSLVSRVAPAHARGAAIGVYNTAQTLGLFFGGVGGGWIGSRFGGSGVFAACAALTLAWLALAAGMQAPRQVRSVNPAGAQALYIHTVSDPRERG